MINIIANPPFGINNVDSAYKETKVAFEEKTAILSNGLKSCMDFALQKDGSHKVRNGSTKIINLTDGHSFWSDSTGTVAFCVDGTSLKRINANRTTTTLATVKKGARMRYIEHKTLDNAGTQNRGIYMGNGHVMYKYINGTLSTWGDIDPYAYDLYGDEFDFGRPAGVYKTPPLSNIFVSHYASIFVAYGRFLFGSEPRSPESFRMIAFVPASETITAVSADVGHIYIHTHNMTKVLTGRGMHDFYETEYPIGAVKQQPNYSLGYPLLMGKQGWIRDIEGVPQRIDFENFELDLRSASEAFLGYNQATREVLCTVNVPEYTATMTGGSTSSGTMTVVTP